MGKIDRIEREQLAFLEENELTREIVHGRFWKEEENKEGVMVKVPKRMYVTQYRGEDRFIIGKTVVYLFRTSDVESMTPKQKKHMIERLKTEGYGAAKCSDLDNYCKKTGRVIATARAIADYRGRELEVLCSVCDKPVDIMKARSGTEGEPVHDDCALHNYRKSYAN